MKQLIYIILLAASMGVTSLLSADNKAKQAVIQLAMNDLGQQGFVFANKSAVVKTQAKQNYSRDCTEWTDWQINQKAKPFDPLINKYSHKYGVDSHLVKSVITAESCFKTSALSHAGARGLMQLIPATAKRFGVTKSYHPEQNIRGGVKYLKFLLARYEGNLEKTIAAYNAGEGKVDRYNGIPPYAETKQYVKNVLKVYSRLKPRSEIVKTQANRKKPAIAQKVVYHPPKLGQKPGRHGWQYNRRLAPHLYKH